MAALARRDFLRAASLAPAALVWPAWLPRMAFAPPETAPRGDTLVVVFLRGAADALNMVVPHGEDAYYLHRPTLAIPRPDDTGTERAHRAIDLDGFFGLHPSLEALLPAWQSGHLAFVHACGAPDESRSHFKAMALMERGVATEQGPASGWIGRHLATLNTDNPSPLRAIGLGERAPQSLRGSVPVSALRSITDYHLGGDEKKAELMRAGLASLYVGEGDLEAAGKETLQILKTLERLDPQDYSPKAALAYPESDFGKGMSQIAMLIKAEVGLEVAAIDLGGWDTHFAQGGSAGIMAGLLSNLGQGLAAFHADLINEVMDYTVVVMSEFGRRAYENASFGTDHGHGSVMFLMGGNLAGGRVHGDWPGLGEGRLFGPGDLAVTVDYRDVLGEICSRRLNNPALDAVFPDFLPTLRGYLI